MAHPKGVLLERAAKLGFERPEFRTERTGPEHEPNFITDVVIDGEVLGTGQGGSKRTAEKRAAEEALGQLDARESGDKARTANGDKSRPVPPAAGSKGKSAVAAVPAERRAGVTDTEDEMASEFDGPWPMFDDLLAATLQVAERRVNADLRGDQARAAIAAFALGLYKDLLADLGDVIDVDEEEDEDDEE